MSREALYQSRETIELADYGVEKLLERAGLNENDLTFLYQFREMGFSVLFHGSGTANELTRNSDIDFAIVGDLSNLPSTLVGDSKVDYVSLPHISQNGRKMSIHYVSEKFRERQPDMRNPYAYEFRAAHNLKKGGVSNYLLPAIDSEGHIALARFACPQSEYGNGVINTTPQTGIFHINGETASTKSGIEFNIEPVQQLGDGSMMVLGLEFDKMYTERAVFLSDGGIKRYTHEPMQRIYREISNWTKTDNPNKIADEALILLADNWDLRRRT